MYSESINQSVASKVSLFQVLTQQPKPLFVLLDAARDEKIFDTLFIQTSLEYYESLFEGDEAEALQKFAPYLVQLSGQDDFLKKFLHDGWGENWGVYLTGEAPFHSLLAHLRRCTRVMLEDGRKVFFRFYDPRVLRVFLPTCTPEQATEFFGPITSYLVEDKNSEVLLQFSRGEQGIEVKKVPVSLEQLELV